MFAFQNFEKTTLVCFIAHFGSSSRKIPHAYVLAFLKGVFPSTACKDFTYYLTTNIKRSRLPIPKKLWGRKNWGEKTHFWKIWKKNEFSGCTPKPLPIVDFWLNHCTESKQFSVEPLEKTRKTTKNFEVFLYFLSNFLQLFRFWITITFLLLLRFAWNLVHRCKTWMSKCSAIFRFFCVRNPIYGFFRR